MIFKAIQQADMVITKPLLKGHVVETKYITTVFESLSMKDLIDDVQVGIALEPHFCGSKRITMKMWL